MMKRILLVIAVLIAASGIIVWRYVNKPAEKVEDVKGLSITAEQLVDAYDKDETAADKLYLNQAIAVLGKVEEISKNQDGKIVVLLQSADPMSGVQCTLRNNVTIEAGKQVTIKGFCNGYTTVVLLSDCILL